METFLNLLTPHSSQEAINIIGLLLAISAVPMAVYFYVKQKQSRTPSYCIRSSQIISELHTPMRGALTVAVRGRPVENLVVSTVVFWNAGNVSIRRGDCAGDHCLEIRSTDKCKILEAGLLRPLADEHKLTLANNDGVVAIDFDFLRPAEGIVLTVAHEGYVQDQPHVAISLKEKDRLQRVVADQLMAKILVRGTHSQTRRWMPRLLTLMGAVLVVLAVYFSHSTQTHAPILMYLFFVVGISYLALAYMLRSRVPGNLLDSYAD